MDIDSEAELEIDPNLFIKCRLCIQETGVYQILPTVRDQIKECFDITVKQYDNLPKLICKKCKGILNEYLLIKKKFLDNQILLQNNTVNRQPFPVSNCNTRTRTLTENTVTTQPEIINDNLIPDATISQTDNPSHKPKNKIKKRFKRKRIESTSSSDTDISTSKSVKKKAEIISPEKLLLNSHEKSFMCRYCNNRYRSLSQIIRHTKTHSKLRSKFKTFVKQHCTVLMDKIDDKSNALGKETAIALRSDILINNVGSPYYYVAYTPYSETKHHDENLDSDQTSSVENVKSKSKNSKRKVSRSSSGDTVVLDNITKERNNDLGLNESTPINLDDDSSSDFVEQELTLGDKDVKAIKKLITMCLKNANNIESLGIIANDNLNKKLLSVGRKTLISKSQNQQPGLPGLIKYLEHKNLPVEFHPIYKNDYVTINTKLYQKNDAKSKLLKWTCLQRTKPIEQQTQYVQSFLSKFNIELQPSKEGCLAEGYLKKLLNSNPVPNPKKLPKKISPQDAILFENPSETIALVEDNQIPNEPDTSNLILIDSDDEVENCVQMPVIMSTESLAPKQEIAEPESKQEKENKPDEETNQNNQSDKYMPRIKCKPVSELMGSNSIPKNNNVSVVTTEANGPKIVYGNMNGSDKSKTLLEQHSEQAKIIPVSTHNNAQNTITLDSPLLPYMATPSPVQYFNNLLQLHGLSLINDCKYSLPKDFVCLVKYKLDITTKHKKNALLAISFYGMKNKFCLKMSRGNQKDVDLQVLSPFWQMEVFKSFNGEVSDKILNCSLKHSAELFQNVKQFLFLLKNIKEKKTIPH